MASGCEAVDVEGLLASEHKLSVAPLRWRDRAGRYRDRVAGYIVFVATVTTIMTISAVSKARRRTAQ